MERVTPGMVSPARTDPDDRAASAAPRTSMGTHATGLRRSRPMARFWPTALKLPALDSFIAPASPSIRSIRLASRDRVESNNTGRPPKYVRSTHSIARRTARRYRR